MTVSKVSLGENLFEMLNYNRGDVAIETRIDGLETIRKLNMKSIRMLEPPLVTIKLYHYLKKSHADLIPRICMALQDMEAEGRIKAVQDEAYAALST